MCKERGLIREIRLICFGVPSTKVFAPSQITCWLLAAGSRPGNPRFFSPRPDTHRARTATSKTPNSIYTGDIYSFQIACARTPSNDTQCWTSTVVREDKTTEDRQVQTV